MAKKGALVVALLHVLTAPADGFSVAPLSSKNTIATVRRATKPVPSMVVATRNMSMNVRKTRMSAQQTDENDEIGPLASVPLSSQIEDIAGGLVQDKDSNTPDSKNKNSAAAVFSKMGDSLTKKRAALAATLMLFVSVFMSPLPSWAVTSGGRMGGSFGSSGGGYSGGASYSAPARSSLRASSYYGQGYNRGFSSGLRSGYYSRPSVVVGQSYGYGISPFYAPTFYSRPSGVVVSSGGGFFDFVTFVGLALAAVFTVSNFGAGSSSAIQGFDSAVGSALGPGVSVAEISVALDVPDRDDRNSILGVLDRLANTARTGTRAGMQTLTSQVAMELLRRKSQIIASSTKSSHFRDPNKASREFNRLAVKERSKFERETTSRYGGVDYGQGSQLKNQEFSPKATKAVVTLLIAIDGDQTTLPKISSQRDVEEALSVIAANSKVGNCLQSAEILWTPEERTETLSMRDVVSDYPELRSI